MNNKKGSGWWFDNYAHALASKGIPTRSKGRWKKNMQKPAKHKEYRDKVTLARYTFKDEYSLKDLADLSYYGRKSIQEIREMDDMVISKWGYPYMEVSRNYSEEQDKDYYDITLTLPPPFSDKTNRALVINYDWDTNYQKALEKMRKIKDWLDDMDLDVYKKVMDRDARFRFESKSNTTEYRTLLLQRDGDKE